MGNSSAITWGRYWCINGSFGIVLNTDWICALSATADDTGGMVSVFNKTGEDVVQLVVC